MSDVLPDPRLLLARAAKLRLFLMLRRTANQSELTQRLGLHLVWMIDQERQGRIFLSGPVAPHSGDVVLDGLTVIRAASLAEAQGIAEKDPFVTSGAVTFELREWTVNEGSLSLSLSLSDSSVAFR